jgi:hypothetical protein
MARKQQNTANRSKLPVFGKDRLKLSKKEKEAA